MAARLGVYSRRIIPARAGFTSRGLTRPIRGTDHPRSRGVYDPTDMPNYSVMGSSPLARGLRRRRRRQRRPRRIIPARAGFTSGQTHRLSHMLGSSPLARGLPPVPGHAGERGGIIPARAGFTITIERNDHGRKDHPRSRGVYFASGSAKKCPFGSSPLARGLLDLCHGVVHGQRIIPARAGFTRAAAEVSADHSDHPRSRGVYEDLTEVRRGEEGSSPLARGLRRRVQPSDRDRWIIPARAGFTAWPAAPGSTSWDHPRSRGVYIHSSYYGDESFGSSPLARGLRALERIGAVDRGIIPARAGFTGRGGVPRLRGPDHPRSRGVYAARAAASASRAGSSPLARGLPPAPRTPAGPHGIIPARAGFTQTSSSPPTGRPDHPRSRGVYATGYTPVDDYLGSSPLARGLLGRLRRFRQITRIIPARAGFTQTGGT